MRGLDTNVKRIRRKVFKEIARVGFESEPETLVADIEAIPYHIVQERATYRRVSTGSVLLPASVYVWQWECL